MVEISNLHDLDIYTMAGRYQGRVVDVVLNMRLGTISKFHVQVLTNENQENADLSFANVIKKWSSLDSEEKKDNQDLFIIDYDEVKAIGDIILVNHRNLEEQE